MKKPLNSIAILFATVALLALPASAGAEYLIPDGNSAVNQYTEGLPTGGGQKDTKGAGEKEVKPAQTIGAKTTRELEQKGPEGKALAEVAAETAPPSVAVDSGDEKSGKSKDTGDKGKSQDQKDGNGHSSDEAGAPAAAQSGGSGPSGSSGIGEIVSAATGSSDGGVGLLLPLVIVAALIWGAIFAWRRRDHDGTATTQS